MLYLFFVITIFVFGLTIGSFINALEYRIEQKKSINGRSFCPECKHQLAWYDLVPIFSFAFLMGKCRYCKKKISWQYPIVELLTGVAFVAIALKITNYQLPITSQITTLNVIGLISLLFITFCLIVIALHDQKTTYVLSGYVYAAIAVTAIFLLVSYTGVWDAANLWNYISPNILASVVAMIPFATLYLFSKGAWMGAGDIEIAALLGFLLGWPYFLVALYFAFIVGSIWGLGKVYMFKNAKLKSEMPFAPFLIAGTFFAFLFAEQLVSLYVKIFLG